jgi:uncharacterized protein YkwD
MTGCLPQQPANTGSSRRTTSNGETIGADANGPTATLPQSTNSSTTTSTSPTSQPVSSDCYKAEDFVCKVERLITEKTNKYRQSRGMSPLSHDSKISFVSRDWSKKQSNSGSIGHSGFPSARQSVYRTEFNESRSMRGENVAYTGMVGRTGQDDAAAERIAEAFANMWWNSSGHRRNMLGNFQHIGVGVAQRSNGAWYATQIFN